MRLRRTLGAIAIGLALVAGWAWWSASDSGDPRIARGIEGRVWRGAWPASARVDVWRVDRPRVGEAPAAVLADAGTVGSIAGDAPLASGRSDATGRFTFDGLGAGTYVLVGRTADGAEGSETATVGADGAITSVGLQLALPDPPRRGRVVHDDGRPWTGAVQALSGPPRNTVSAGPDGRFALRSPTGPVTTVRAGVPGAWWVSWPLDSSAPTEEQTLTLPEPDRETAGRVSDSRGEPIAGAQALWQGGDASGPREVVATTTGADGRFRVASRFPMQMVQVWADGFALASVSPSEDGELAVRLARRARVEGRVTTADGEPVAGAAVVARGPRERVPALGGRSAITDGAGRYALDGLVPGATLVHVEGGGWRSPELDAVRDGGFNPFLVTLRPGEAATRDLVAIRGRSLRGTVMHRGGAPVRGATVEAWPLTVHHSPLVAGATALTDAHGTFAFTGLAAAADFHLRVTAPRTTVQTATVSATEGADVTVVVPEARWLRIRAMDAEGRTPVAGAGVSVQGSDGQWLSGSATAADGWANVGYVPVDAQSVRFRASGYAPTHRLLNAAPAADGEWSQTVALDPGLTLTGRVETPDGAPAKGVDVTASRGSGVEGFGHAFTEPDGTFRITGLSTGPLRVTANGRGRPELRDLSPATLEVAAGGPPVTLRLGAGPAPPEPGPSLRVRVLGADGNPVPWARIGLLRDRKVSWHPASEGVTEIRSVDAGSPATLFVYGAAESPTTHAPLPLGPWLGGPYEPDVEEVTVRLPHERTVRGTVRDFAGAPVLGVLVRAFARSEGWDVLATWPWNRSFQSCLREPGEWHEADLGIAHGMARSDARGEFEIGGLGDLDYDLWVEGPLDAPPAPPVRAHGGDADVEVALLEGVSPRVTVLDEAGEPFAGATAWAYLSSGERLRPPLPGSRGGGEDPIARSGADGVATLRGLTPGRVVSLRVSPPEGATRGLLPVDLPSWTPADTTVRLDGGRIVRVEVREADGQVSGDAHVLWRDADDPRQPWRTAAKSSDGAFATERVRRPARIALRAHATRGKERAWRAQTEAVVAPEAAEAVLTLAPARTLRVTVEDPLPAGLEFLDARLEPVEADAPGRWQERVRNGTATIDHGLWADDALAIRVRAKAAGAWVRAVPVTAVEIRVRLGPGLSVRGTLSGAEGAEELLVWADAWGMGVEVERVDATHFEARGLPPGPCQVGAHARFPDGSTRSAEATVEAGGTVTLTLTPPQPK